MALPHPHGSAAGQIAHNSSFDTGVTPGSTGGKFIGFGEEGTSAKANRAHWALSENIDYLYDVIAADRAIPAGAAFTSTGQSSYQVTDDVFSGDSSYPGSAGTSDPEGMLQLFSVLDDQYNELQDINGDEVRVKRIRESTDTTDVYKSGFVTNPYLHFHTVDPNTGVEQTDPYVIPNAQQVRIIYGAKSNLENLPTDAFTKFNLQSANEVEAGAFLQNGTKKMTGNFDADGNQLLNIDQIDGESTNDLLIRSLSAKLQLEGATELELNDQHLSAAVPLSQAGETGIDGFYTSLVGAINSNTQVNDFHDNRTVDQAGSLTFTDGTGNVAWPTLNVLIDGNYRSIAAGNLTATNSATVFVLCVNSSGTVVERAPQSVQVDDVVIAAYTWNGAAFTLKLDLRRKLDSRTGQLEITCGSSSGTDFNSNQLQEAIEFCARMSHIASLGHGSIILRIAGTAIAPTTPNTEVDIRNPIMVKGYGVDLSFIYSDENNGATTVLFDCNQNRVHFEDLTLVHSGNTQTGTLGCFRNAGDGSVFRNLKFDKDGGTFDIGFGNAFSWTSAAKNILIEKIEVTEVTSYFLLGSQADYDTAYLTESTIREIYIQGWGAAAITGIVANGDGNRIYNVEFVSGLDDYCIVAGNDTLIDGCKFRMTGATDYSVTANGGSDNITAPAANIQTATVALGAFTAEMVGGYVIITGAVNAANNGMFWVTAQTATTISYINSTGVIEASSTATFNIEPAGVLYYPLGTPVYDQSTAIRDCMFLRINGAALRYSPINNTATVSNVSMRDCRTNQVHKPIDLSQVIAVHASSQCQVRSNHFRDTDDWIANIQNLWHFRFVDNICTTTTGSGIIIGGNGGGLIHNNFFEGYGSAGPFDNIIELAIGLPWVNITNNVFGVTGAPASGQQLNIWRPCNITGNHVAGTGAPATTTGIYLRWFVFGANNALVANNFIYDQKYGVRLDGGANQCRIVNNAFTGFPTLSVGIYLINAVNTLVQGNHFNSMVGQAIDVRSSISTDCESTQIVGNHFRNCEGDGPGAWACVRLDAGSGGCINPSINENHFQNIGSTLASTSTQYVIKADCLAAQVCNNHFQNGIGPGVATALSVYRFISCVSEGILVDGNVLYQSINSMPAETMQGIFVDFNSGVAFRRQTINNNVINFFGTNNTANIVIIGIDADDSDDLTCIGNYQREYTAGGAGATKLFVRASLGTSNLFIGNRSRTISSSINAAGYPDPVNTYSASTSIPRQDMNAGSNGF